MEQEIQQYIGIDYSLNYTNMAIYGIIQLQIKTYLVLIVNSQHIADFTDRQIYQIKQLVFIPIKSDTNIPNEDTIYIQMIKNIVCDECCYYSPNYNLSHSFQSNTERDRFVINKQYSTKISNKTFVIYGLFQIYTNSTFIYCQIVRRETLRQGRRFTQRGCDLKGNCTNYCEIEDILIINNQIYSYIQIRGSMPFRWSQYPTLKYKPDIKIDSNEEQNTELCYTHLYDQIHNYKEILILNLIDKKGQQLELGNYFQQLLEGFSRREVQYFWFEFNQKTEKQILTLINEIESVLEQYEYYQQSQNGKIINKQNGVIRTNCMSCIDRSNIVQNKISKFMIHYMIKDQKILDQIDTIHNVFWINTGNQLSRLYSGTIALKNYYIVKGYKTTLDLLKDSYLLTQRYFINHFNDYHIQNSIDLTLGLWNMNDPRFHSYKFQNGLLKCLLYFIIITMILYYLGLSIFSPIIPFIFLYNYPQLYEVKPILMQ